METKPDRLKSAYGELIRRGLVSTQKDVAAKMKASVTNVSSAFNGNETYITDRFLMRFNAAFDNIFSPEWLRTGEGTMLRGEVPAVASATPKDYRLVDIINIDAVGGVHSDNAITFSEQYPIGRIPFTNAREGDVAILQSGNSMSPTIPPGSVLLIREVVDWQEYLDNGVYVIWLKDDRRITKEIRRYPPRPSELHPLRVLQPRRCR